jgi:hypothetical protein
MSHQPTYQQGYINGYLESLLTFYNLRYKHANDYRHLESRFIQLPASADLAQDVFHGLAGYYKRSSAFQLDKALLFSDSLELKQLNIVFNELGKLLEPWLPNEEEKILAREYHVPDDQLPEGERLIDYFLDFVLKDYGLGTGEYRLWKAVVPTTLMKTFSYCTDEMFTLVIENGRHVNILHFGRRVIYP